MRSAVVCAVAGAVAVLLSGCARNSSAVPSISDAKAAIPASPPGRRIIRSTGLIQALEWKSIRVPQLSGSSSRLTLTRLTPNGRKVSKGDVLVEFDRTSLLDDELDAKARLSDLAHQWEEKKALVNADAARRLSQLKEAEADLQKAELQLRKGPILSEIDRLQNEAKAENARARVASLKKSDQFRRRAEEASVKILKLKHERQQVTLARIQTNLERLLIRAPQDGMVALENTWRNGSMGPSQEGDQVWPGIPLLRIFDPTRMVVQTTIGEPDIASLSKASRARLFLDAYPGVNFDAKLESASPVATAGMDSPVRTFNAVFLIEQQHPLLLPDLSAALEVDMGATAGAVQSASKGVRPAHP